MARTINFAVDDEIVERKEALGRTHEDIYMAGLAALEAEQAGDTIAETVG